MKHALFLRRHRERCGLHQEHVADRLRLSRQLYQKMESTNPAYTRAPSLWEMRLIAEAMDLSLAQELEGYRSLTEHSGEARAVAAAIRCLEPGTDMDELEAWRRAAGAARARVSRHVAEPARACA